MPIRARPDGTVERVTDPTAPADRPAPGLLDAVNAEIEAHLAEAGWEQPPSLFALVPTRLVAAEPEGPALLGLPGAVVDAIPDDSLTPVAQEALPDAPLDEALAQIEWPPMVSGCALAQEIVILPPEAEAEVSAADPQTAVSAAAAHPDRREGRLVVAVLRDGTTSSVLRLRGDSPAADEIAFGTDLAPNLTVALRDTLR